MTGLVWRVVVARDLDDADHTALARVGASYISGHYVAGTTSSSILVRADDERGARVALATALGEDVVILDAQPQPVFVHAPIDPSARSAFENAAGEDERVGGVVEDESTGELEVYFVLPRYQVLDRVFDEARDLYRHTAGLAGLEATEPPEMTLSGLETLMIQASRDRQLLDRAGELLDGREYELSIVLAQTACELVVADALRSLVQPHVSDEVRAWILGRVKGYTLMDPVTRDLWKRVAGSALQDQPFWNNYQEHVRRRNGIVHLGDRADERSARESLDAARTLFNYVVEMVARREPRRSDA